jgi:hypothetical protein
MQTETIQSAVSLIVRDTSRGRLEVSRLLAAAVINQEFCSLLLDDPDLALKNGFQGESFLFEDGERDLILSIRAASLPDLAGQLARTLDEQIAVKMDNPVLSIENMDF